MTSTDFMLRRLAAFACWTILILSACSGPVRQEPVSYYRYNQMTESGGSRIDTLEQLPFHDPKDSLLAHSHFYWKGIRHVLSGFTSDLHRPVDGGSFVIELDSFGVIYAHSTAWPSFMFVRSSNDSIDELFVAAIAAANRPDHLGLHYRPIWPEAIVPTVDFMKAEQHDTLPQ